jgi:hypothetical protein
MLTGREFANSVMMSTHVCMAPGYGHGRIAATS